MVGGNHTRSLEVGTEDAELFGFWLKIIIKNLYTGDRSLMPFAAGLLPRDDGLGTKNYNIYL
jgi:hypothetical protein